MLYKITIEMGDEATRTEYPKWHSVYAQVCNDLDVSAVIATVNGLLKVSEPTQSLGSGGVLIRQQQHLREDD